MNLLNYSLVAAFSTTLLLGGCARHEPTADGKRYHGRVVHHTRTPHREPERIPPACSPAWNRLVDRRLGISDASGHGPDIGSREWMDAVSRKSGVIDAAGHGPDPGSEEWCRAVDYKVFGRR